MIKFFRKIRQKLLAENKFTKYLIYAAGEIILVVIGILIALHINNVSNEKKARKKEIVLLNEMKSNLTADLKDLAFNIKHNKNRTHCNEVIRTVIEQKLPYNDTLKPYFGNIFGNFQLSENTSAWQNLKSVGLDLISNDSLRKTMSDLYANKYAYLENLEKGLDDRYHWDYLYPKILEHMVIDEIWVSAKPRNYEALLKDVEFYEILKLHIKWRYYMQNQYELNYKSVLALQEQINSHLKSLAQ